MAKSALSDFSFFAHQLKAIRESTLFPCRLIYRLPGTGKTVIGVEILKRILSEKNSSYLLWIGPANLLRQYKDFFEKLSLPSYYFNAKEKGIVPGSCTLVSYETFRLYIDFFLFTTWDCIVCDEAHRAKNPLTQTHSAIRAIRSKTKRLYAFTGTPFQNTPYEFFDLISLVAGKDLSRACENTLQYMRPKRNFFHSFLSFLGFRLHRLNQGPIIGVKEPDRLRGLISKFIDYLPSEFYIEECRLPSVKERFSLVQISDFELSIYKKTLTKYRRKSDKDFLGDTLTDDVLETTFNRLSELRQCLLDPAGGPSSKILKCAEDIQDIIQEPQNKVLVFCNFVDRGLLRIAPILNLKQISYGLISGKTGNIERRELISSYMSGEIQVLLLSPVGFEGLDLYGTTHILVLDPHFNPERTLQLTSRAIRAFSKVPVIDITHYISVSEKFGAPIIDEAILKIAERKKQLREIIESCLY